jgi:(S)-citramalyl-CoA lyase
VIDRINSDAHAGAYWLVREDSATNLSGRSLLRRGHVDDVSTIARLGKPVSFVRLPKCEDPPIIAHLARILDRANPPSPLLCLIETVSGIERAQAIIAERGCAGVMFGAFDYAADAGCAQRWDILLAARSRLAALANAQGKIALDAPFGAIDNAEGAKWEAHAAKHLGFTGKVSIHPKFLTASNEIFTSSAEERAYARKVIDAFEAAGCSVVKIDGKMIDFPVIRRLERILSQDGSSAP